MAGITQYGFERKTLQELYTSLQDRFRTKLGNNWNTTDGSVEQQFIGVFAEELDQAWQGIEGVYSSQTINGAEGIYLDDVLSLTGVFRQGKTASSGNAILLSDASLLSIGSVLNQNTTISASNNLTYLPTSVVSFDNQMDCYRLSSSQLVVGQQYTFNIYALDTPTTASFNWTVASEQDKDTMLIALAEYINNTVFNTTFAAYYNPISRTTYIGFDPATNLPSPVQQRLYVNSTPKVGLYGHLVALEATETGFNPLAVQGLLNINPQYNGYISIINYNEFFSGSDVQTDAEYRQSFDKVDRTSLAGTEDSLINALLSDTPNVTAAIVHQNPTEDFVYDISSNLVAKPYTYNTVVLGGAETDIAQTILSKGPLNTATYGETTIAVNNVLGQPRNISFTRATYFDFGVKVTYQSKNNAVLSEVEVATLKNALIEYVNSLNIADEILLEEIKSLCYATIPSTKRRGITVEIRDLTSTGDYIQSDLQPDYKEKPRLTATNVVVNRTV